MPPKKDLSTIAFEANASSALSIFDHAKPDDLVIYARSSEDNANLCFPVFETRDEFSAPNAFPLTYTVTRDQRNKPRFACLLCGTSTSRVKEHNKHPVHISRYRQRWFDDHRITFDTPVPHLPPFDPSGGHVVPKNPDGSDYNVTFSDRLLLFKIVHGISDKAMKELVGILESARPPPPAASPSVREVEDEQRSSVRAALRDVEIAVGHRPREKRDREGPIDAPAPPPPPRDRSPTFDEWRFEEEYMHW